MLKQGNRLERHDDSYGYSSDTDTDTDTDTFAATDAALSGRRSKREAAGDRA